jgi:hypothetical protein
MLSENSYRLHVSCHLCIESKERSGLPPANSTAASVDPNSESGALHTVEVTVKF